MEPTSSFRRAFAIQGRVLHALMMREAITRFGRENMGVLWMIGEPMLFTLGVAALWSAAGMHHGSSLPIAAFALTGYSSVLVWRNVVNRCNSAIQHNLNLLYHRNVRVLDVFLARIALELVGATASFAVLAVAFISLGWVSPPSDLLTMAYGWLLLAWFGSALAILIGAASSYSEIVDRLWHPAAYLLFPLSGAAYMVDWLPPSGRELALLLPMVHGVEIVREGFFGDVVRTHYDAAYMAACNLGLTFAGLLLLRDAISRRGGK